MWKKKASELVEPDQYVVAMYIYRLFGGDAEPQREDFPASLRRAVLLQHQDNGEDTILHVDSDDEMFKEHESHKNNK